MKSLLNQTGREKTNKEKGHLSRSHVLKVLHGKKDVLLEKYGVTRLGIFGSVARDQATEKSDVDVVIEMERPNLFTSVECIFESKNRAGSTLCVIAQVSIETLAYPVFNVSNLVKCLCF